MTLLTFHGIGAPSSQRLPFISQCQGSPRSNLPAIRPVRTENATPPHPPFFHQVLILKVVKALCFDTLSQVLILKGFTGGRKSSEISMRFVARGLAFCVLLTFLVGDPHCFMFIKDKGNR
jgi:hypothetical protein